MLVVTGNSMLLMPLRRPRWQQKPVKGKATSPDDIEKGGGSKLTRVVSSDASTDCKQEASSISSCPDLCVASDVDHEICESQRKRTMAKRNASQLQLSQRDGNGCDENNGDKCCGCA